MPTAVPKYQRVYESIKARIESGQYPPGSRLPSTTALLAEHEVGYGTLRTAILRLKDEGLIYGQPGEAVYVAERPPAG
jgi:GntR family transcriptional regulator